MKQTINQWQFLDAFKRIRPESFSRNGLIALFEHLEEYEEACGEELELDVIALCCDFTEYDSLQEFQDNYGGDYETLGDVEYQTTVISLDESDSFIIQDF